MSKCWFCVYEYMLFFVYGVYSTNILIVNNHGRRIERPQVNILIKSLYLQRSV